MNIHDFEGIQRPQEQRLAADADVGSDFERYGRLDKGPGELEVAEQGRKGKRSGFLVFFLKLSPNSQSAI